MTGKGPVRTRVRYDHPRPEKATPAAANVEHRYNIPLVPPDMPSEARARHINLARSAASRVLRMTKRYTRSYGGKWSNSAGPRTLSTRVDGAGLGVRT